MSPSTRKKLRALRHERGHEPGKARKKAKPNPEPATAVHGFGECQIKALATSITGMMHDGAKDDSSDDDDSMDTEVASNRNNPGLTRQKKGGKKG